MYNKSVDNSLEPSFITNFSTEHRGAHEELILKYPEWEFWIEEVAYGDGGFVVKGCNAFHSVHYATETSKIWEVMDEYVKQWIRDRAS